MVEQAGAPPSEAETSLADSRAQFVASLGRRLEALRQALFALEQAPKSAALRDHLRRRIHAFGAAAGVLGFDRVFDAFREAEGVLGRTSATALGPAELGLVARTVNLVPSLVLGAAAPVARHREAGVTGVERRGGGWPTSVLVFGSPGLAEAFERNTSGSDGATLEYERAEEVERAESIVRITGPDVAVIDADREGARELMETLVYDPLLDPVRIIAVGTFDRPEAAATLVALGVARVLPKPVSPDTLRRSVLEVSRERAAPPERIDPLGDLTVEELGERIAQEVRRGLVEAVKAQGRSASIALGPGTDVLAAVWSAVARVRELVTLRSGGIVRFDSSGPEGAVPLAPWMGTGDERSRTSGSSESRSGDGVNLEGRTVVVVDDDPAVVWFISGLLRAGGAEVIEAHDGAYALDVARKCSPDVIVSDILMPGLDGFALCREVKRDVALSDVPVILLSWKEDLLQRVRELGADAEGYLRKEATASAIVQRVREVLLPRARVEVRLSEGGPSRGRLDGLTPRLILDLVCKKSKDARLTVRDAAYLYEVDVRGGRVRNVTRTSSDGRFERGSRALSGLLGVRAGRFTVTRDSSPCTETWDAELDELIAEHVERARAAQRALADPARVAQVEIEEGVLEPYLTATPLSAAAIVRRLAEGVPPSDIVATGASPRLLESVLVDLVLHGAITRIVGFDGADLLRNELSSLQERRDSVEMLAAKDFRTPGPPGAAIARSRDAAIQALAATSARGAAAIAPEPQDDAGGFDDWEFAPGAAPSAKDGPGGPDELFALLRNSVVPTAAPVEERAESGRVSLNRIAPPTSLPAEPSPLETALRSLPAAVSARFWREQSEPPVTVPATPGGVAAKWQTSPETMPAIAHLPSAGPPPMEAGPEAVPSEPVVEAPPTMEAGTGTSEAEAPPSPEIVEMPATEVAATEPAPERQKEDVAETSSEDAAKSTEADVDAKPPEDAEAGAVVGTKTAVSRVAEMPSNDSPPEVVPPSVVEEPVPTQPSNPPPPAAAPPELELGDAVASAIGVAPERSSSPDIEMRDSNKPGPSKGGMRTTPPVGARSLIAGSRRPPASSRTPAVPPRGQDGPSVLTIAALTLVAGVAAFALVTAWRGGFEASPKPAESAVAPSEPSAVPSTPAPLPSAVTAASGAPTIRTQDLELPPGLTVSQDRGLLEVDVESGQSVYVDGVFIGRGPIRQVPLREGAHEIRIQGPSSDLAQPIEVHRGRRTHVEMTRAP